MTWLRILPGLALTLLLALAAAWLATLPGLRRLGLTALPISIVVGMLIGNSLYPRLTRCCHHGIDFARSSLLRFGIILYGFRLTFQGIATVGTAAILIDTLMVASTFLLACWLGRRWLGLEREDAILIGAGSSICGAAAVLATEPVVEASADKVAVAVATVVVFGTLSMFLYPVLYALAQPLGFSEFDFGVYTGSTVHEVAQVLAAARTVSETAATTAVITKMIRVMLLAPFLVIVSLWLARGPRGGAGSRHGLGIPWFAVAFIGIAGFNSLQLLPAGSVAALIAIDDVVLAMAMGALGLTTHISAIRHAGARPLLLASMLFVWLVGAGALINVGILHLLH
jgi:uncharacterized integral membrane protein (TIGR00698 family)